MLDEERRIIEGGDLVSQYGIIEFNSLSKALEQRPELAFVCNPSSSHIDTAIEIAQSGCHLFIEKPLSASLAGTSQLVDIAREKRLTVMVGYQMRFHPGLLQVRDWLSKSRVGRLVSAHITHGEHLENFHPYESYKKFYAGQRSLGGGVVFTQIHEINYALWLFGTPTAVFAVGGRRSNLEIDVEDVSTALLKYDSEGKNLPVSISVNYLQRPPARSLHILGDSGEIALDFYKERTARLSNWRSGENETVSFSKLDVNDLFISELKHFLQRVDLADFSLSNLIASVTDVRVASAIRESLESGNVIRL